jgi:UDP-N-acetylmuramoyl-tripeptide--D-alanyl-D-alanine ligase
MNWSLLIYTILFAIRSLRWIAIIQQKEYRMDRLFAFLYSKEGKKELQTVLNLPQKLAQLKRPQRTSRALITLGLFFLIISISILTLLAAVEFYNLASGYLALGLISLYITIPVFLVISVLPTAIIAQVITLITLKKARAKLNTLKPTIIGITGSYGKTSTKLLLEHFLKTHNPVFATPKSFNTRYSIAKSLLTRYEGEPYAILEYGAYTKGEIKAVAKYFKPDVAVVTGITNQHHQLFKSLINIKKAKSELVKALPPHAPVFIHGADPETLKVAEMGSASTIIDGTKPLILTQTFKVKNKPVIKRSTLKYTLDKEGRLVVKWADNHITTSLFGLHYKDNLNLALTIAIHLGAKLEDCLNSLKVFVPKANFIKSYRTKSGAQVIDDGQTANPKGFKAALDLIKKIPSKRKLLLTGGIVDLGRTSTKTHRDLAKKASSFIQSVLCTGPEGYPEFKKVFRENCINDTKEIVNVLKSLENGDLILIEGKIKPELLSYLSPSSKS